MGLPVAVAFAEAGFKVNGVDTDGKKVAAINRGALRVADVPRETVAALTSTIDVPDTGSLHAFEEYSALDRSDAAIVCVPTPLGKTREPDLSYLVADDDEIAQHLQPGMLVVLESTSYPGTTEELLLPRLQAANGGTLKVGKDFFLAFSPERIDPGRKDWTMRNTTKVVGGVTPRCLEVATTLYEAAVETIVPVSSPNVAEMAKLLENTFRATNIALVNEIALMCDRLRIDVWEVIEAATTKPFGFMPFYPGPGMGGHCIRVDPLYLGWKMRTLDYNARFVELAEEINTGMPAYVLGRVSDLLKDVGKVLRGARVLVLGVAYKADVADTRESPAIDLIELLLEKGVEVSYNDPHVPELSLEGRRLTSSVLEAELLRQSDCVVIVTAHSSYDWRWIANHSRLVMDTRNATAGLKVGTARVVRL